MAFGNRTGADKALEAHGIATPRVWVGAFVDFVVSSAIA
jgi:hypothetical protein